MAIFLCLYLVLVVLNSTGHESGLPLLFNVTLFLSFFIAYLRINRWSSLLCFEIMAIPVAFLGLFFDDIIFPLSPEFAALNQVGVKLSRIKSENIQMLSLFALLLGCVYGNDSPKNFLKNNLLPSSRRISFKALSYILASILLLVLIHDYDSGVISSWFYYSNADWMDVEERNKGLGHITCLLLAVSCVEIIRLRDNGVNGLMSFVKQINKLYLIQWIGVAFLLYISGNRNEMLLILLPLIVGYNTCINKISNKFLLIGSVVGILLMAVAGMTRFESVSIGGSPMGIYSLTRDFAGLGYNTDFLIDYSDKNGHTNFQEVPVLMLSGIPYIGNIIIKTMGLKGPVPSANLCTESVYMASSGLGTSIIGDLYYTAGVFWVIIYMILFGYLMSRLYNSKKNINIYWLIFYAYMVSNAVYYIRSSWSFPITEIEYAIIIVFVGQIICNKYDKKHI